MSYRQKIQKIKKDMNALMREVLCAVYHFERFKEKHFGITYELYYAMTLVAIHRKQTISDIATAMGIPLHKATRIVQRLHAKRLVERKTFSQDKRVVYVSLTRDGKKCLATIENFCFYAIMNNLAGVSADEFAMIIQVASKIPEMLALPKNYLKEVQYGK